MDNKITILLIEDNEDHVDLFKDNLEMTSFYNATLEISESMAQGVNLLQKQKYDILFLDLTLKDSDIGETLEKVNDLTTFCPVVVLTSLDDRKTILDVIQKGADDCLPKSDLSPSLLERSIQFNIDRRKDKQKLIESEQRFSDLYNNSPDMYVSVDAETAEIIECNQTLAGKLKYSKEEIHGRKIFELYHPDCLDEVKRAFNLFVTTGEVHDAELHLMRKDGGKLDVLLNVAAVRNKEGKILHSRSCWIDISEKKAAEREKQRAFESMRLILDGLEALVYVADMETYRLLFVNKSIRDYYGDIEGSICWQALQDDLTGPCSFCTNDKLLDHKGNSKGVYTWEYYNKKAKKCFLVHDRAIEWVTGKIVKLEIATDITEKMLMEKKLKELNENLEKQVAIEVTSRLKAEEEKKAHEAILIQQSKIAAMGEMIGAIAHQWRQPLNALGIMIQDIQDAYEYGELSEKYINDIVRKSVNQIQFMSGTINDFRNFYKTSKIRETFNVVKAITSATSLLEAQFSFHTISINMKSSKNGTLAVTGYLNEFKQAVLNIVSNAGSAIIEARQEGMSVEETGEILIDISQEKEIIIINICNRGKHIPEEIIGRIFEPYFTTKNPAEGTGIGLYMSKMIIEKNMGGKLYAKNIVNGVKFTIELLGN